MTAARYEELLGKLLDGEIAAGESDELARALAASPELCKDLRAHLGLWELWSHQTQQERSENAFMDSLRTRLTAEEEGDQFTQKVQRLLRLQPNTEPDEDPAVPSWRRFISKIGRPRFLAWGFPLSCALVAIVLWCALPRSAQAIQGLHGEVICTHCVLHEEGEHNAALRVHQHDTTCIYYLDPANPSIGDFCSAPVAVIVSGKATQSGKKLRIALSSIEKIAESAKSGDARVLFPF